MMSKCTENSNKEEYDSRDITMSKGGSGDHSLEAGDQIPSQQTRQLKSLQISDTNKDSLTSKLENLSPTTKKNVQVIIESLSNHKAVVGEDEKGRPTVQYKQTQKLYWDGSNANKIAVPKSDQDIRIKTDVFLEMLQYIKSTKAPSGVVSNTMKIHTENGQYREGMEFERTKEILGRGNSAGDIVVLRDKFTDTEHAQKTIMISVFRPEEISAWVDLSLEGLSPELYLFRLEGNKVVVHMEKLENAITLNDVIDRHVEALRQANAALLKPFSLSIFHNLLDVVHTMHEKGWTHRDLHSGNVMIQKLSDCEVQIKVLDFGSAARVDDVGGSKGIRSDIINALRNFSALYLEEFQSQLDLERNWKEKMQGLPDEEKAEIFCLFESALKVLTLDDMADLKQTVNVMAQQEIEGEVADIMKEVVPILFPEKFTVKEDSDNDDAVDFAPPSLDYFIKKLRRSIMIGC
uniref:Uncharacterized protein LOC111114075 isoform X2 n=1 Tax=Crassostrea virginica TaxID=6565 RepID=A0A8B8BZ32_CRAVI|nr:uncharacterized protein LOC111114075 isoform X2 [Crassostrea virginica]